MFQLLTRPGRVQPGLPGFLSCRICCFPTFIPHFQSVRTPCCFKAVLLPGRPRWCGVVRLPFVCVCSAGTAGRASVSAGVVWKSTFGFTLVHELSQQPFPTKERSQLHHDVKHRDPVFRRLSAASSGSSSSVVVLVWFVSLPSCVCCW